MSVIRRVRRGTPSSALPQGSTGPHNGGIPSPSGADLTLSTRCVAVPKKPVPSPKTEGIRMIPEGLKFPPRIQLT